MTTQTDNAALATQDADTAHGWIGAEPAPVGAPVDVLVSTTDAVLTLTEVSDVEQGDELEVEREQARTRWRDSAAAGRELTGRELAAMVGRSERWGRDRIAEVRNSNSVQDGTPTARLARRGGTRRTAPARRTQRSPITAPDAPTGMAPDSTTTTADPASTTDAGGMAPANGAARQDTRMASGARMVAWIGFLFGTLISVAANVLYAWLPTIRGDTGAPGLAPQIGAAVWPIALVISVEVLSRVPWRPGWAWQLARYGGAGVVALGAAVISYGHLRGVLTEWDYGTVGAMVGPLVVDGLMTISGFALLAMGDHGTATSGTAPRGTAVTR